MGLATKRSCKAMVFLVNQMAQRLFSLRHIAGKAGAIRHGEDRQDVDFGISCFFAIGKPREE